MCTLSIVTSLNRGSVRLLMNRDERRLRPVAQPPFVRATRSGAAVWPTDPVSGGSWIAVNDAGVALVVMNRNGGRTPPGTPSRGDIVPILASCRTLDDVTAGWRAIDPGRFAPFRLVAVARATLAVFDQGDAGPVVSSLGRAQVFSSSSLGDEQVAGPRWSLLEHLLRREPDPWMAQTRFHQHAWPDRRHLSVMMSRPDACTVSCTEIVLAPEAAELTYRPVVDGWPAGAVARRLALAGRIECAA